MKKIGMCAVLVGLLFMTIIASAFAEEGNGDNGNGNDVGDSSSSSSSGSSVKLGGTPKKVCEGTRYSYDNSGVSEYKMKWYAKLANKILDPRYETVLRSVIGVKDFSNSVKWKACAKTAE